MGCVMICPRHLAGVVFAGQKEDTSLCFWIRICPAIESTSDDTGGLAAIIVMNMSHIVIMINLRYPGDLRDRDIALEKHTCLCFYHRYTLSIAACEELDLAGFADSSTGEENSSESGAPSTSKKKAPAAVAPPPKAPKKDDVIVCMILRNPSVRRPIPGHGRGAGEEVDVSVEEDDDQMGSAMSTEELLRGRQDDEVDEAHVSRAGASPRRPPRTPRTPSHMREIKGLGAGGTGATGSNADTVKTDYAEDAEGGHVVVHPPYICNPSPFAEVVGWGRNSAYLFDKSIDKLKATSSQSSDGAAEKSEDDSKSDPNYLCFNPTRVLLPPSVVLERVYMIACSHRHMLLLTYNGSVYSCGDNTEGALGLGDNFNRTALTLILWPTDADGSSSGPAPGNPLAQEREQEGDTTVQDSGSAPYKKIVYIAAGSAAIGSHSMALTDDGQLYGWGVPYAAGHGVLEGSSSPRLVDVPSADPPEDNTPPADDAANIPPRPVARVKHVACGGGFTVAVLTSGHVVSFGMWAHGRLGLGPPPLSKINRGAGAMRGRAGRDKKKIVRYQLKPRIVPGIRNAVKVRNEVGFHWRH